MTPNKYQESPKTKTVSLVKQFRSQTTLTVYFSGCSSRYEAELVVFMVSFCLSLGINIGLKYYLRHELFNEKKPYIQLQTKFKHCASYISYWLRSTCITSTLTVFTNSNIFQQTHAPNITHILVSKIIGIVMMLEDYLLELESVFI